MLRVAVCCLAVMLASLASADDQRDEAKAHFELGRVEYRSGKPRAALAEFKKAYDIAPVPELLYNIGLCQEQLGDLNAALGSYLRYEATRGDQNHAEVDAHIAELQRLHASPPPTVDAEQALAVVPIRRKPIYKRWWLWTSVALVVAGGVAAGTVLGLRATTPPRLTFPGGYAR